MKGISGRDWVVLSDFIKPDESLIRKYGYFLAQLMVNRNIREIKRDTKLKEIPHYSLIPNLETAVEKIVDAVKKSKRIILYGDYDVDGITSTAILYDVLLKARAKVYPVLPTRFTGYGLNRDLMKEFSAYGDLLITLDNGTSAVNEIDSSNMEVIVIDHHNVPEVIPKRAVLVNPRAYETEEELKELSSSGLVFYLAALLSRELELDIDVREYLDLVALGTVADVMRINYVNRIFIEKGIKLLKEILQGNVEKPGIKELLRISGINGDITTKDIAFSIAPRLNAPGRIGDPKIAMRLLIERDRDRAIAFARKIEEINRKRKAITARIFKEALEQAERNSDKAFITVWKESWHPGVIGIVAGRLANYLGKPVAVFSKGKTLSVGSVRSVEGIDIYSGLKDISYMFVKWGGHSQAVGLTLETENLEEFSEKTEEIFKNISREQVPLYADMYMKPSELSEEHFRDIEMLEPYGEGNPYPSFVASVKPESVDRSSYPVKVIVDGKKLVCWEEEIAKYITEGSEIHIFYTVMKNEMIIEDISKDGSRENA